MIPQLLHLYGFNLHVARATVRDLTPEQMVAQPHGLVNHPAWSLGHLVMTADGLAKLLGLAPVAPERWGPIFATGGIPSGEQSLYPPKDTLVEALASQHARNHAVVEETDPAWFASMNPDPKRRARFPAVGDQVAYLMTSHEMLHLGQLAAWRRAMGLPPARR